MYETGFYFDWLAAAFVRGLWKDPELAYPADRRLQLDTPFECLAAADIERIVRWADDCGIRLQRFKRTSDIPRVRRVLHLLHGIDPASLLDVGCGRGMFLWPLLDAFPSLKVRAVDNEEGRVRVVQAVTRGGVSRLAGGIDNATHLVAENASFEVVTLLEVIEHVPEVMRALVEAVRVAKRYVVISVPDRGVGSPQNTHLLSAERLSEMLILAGASRVTIDSVPDHIIAIGKTAHSQ